MENLGRWKSSSLWRDKSGLSLRPRKGLCVSHTPPASPPASAPPASPRTAAFYASAPPLVSLLPQRPLSKGESFLKCTLSSIQHPCWAPSPPSLFKG